MPGNIIFLNGPSSAGKTTLAYALQSRFEDIYFRLSADDFMKMIDLQKMHDNFYELLDKAFDAMHHTIKLFSDRGQNVIVDHVLLDTPEEKHNTPDCVRLLHENPVLFVRVDCSLAELERRERERGDRNIGQARWQSEHMHMHNIYDLCVDTSGHSAEECAGQIIALLAQPEKWSAFGRLHGIYFPEE